MGFVIVIMIHIKEVSGRYKKGSLNRLESLDIVCG